MNSETVHFSQHELEIIKNLENARHFKDMMDSEGWRLFLELKEKRIGQIRDQFWKAKMDKDALWASQIRAKGIEEFMEALIEGMNNAVECLNPQVLKQIFKVNPDYEGEVSLPALPEA